MTNKEKRQQLINLFNNNKDKWIDKEILSHLIQEPNNIIRSWISILRQSGYTIVSKKKLGYKLTTDKAEIRAFAENEIRKNRILMDSYYGWLKDLNKNIEIKKTDLKKDFKNDK